MITPAEIEAKAAKIYPRMLPEWLVDAELSEFFPRVLRARLTPIKNDLPATIAAVNALRMRSKQERGWGYTIHWQDRRSRAFGHNRFPHRITIDTLEDLLRLARKKTEFADACRVVQRVREEFPQLEDWLRDNICVVHKYALAVEGLIAVTRFIIENPRPNCFARQIPVPVDTKFVERHESVLRAWLDELLPASAIEYGEKAFALRFGLRDGQPHVAVRTLDCRLQDELNLPFDEFSVPIPTLAQIPVHGATVFIVENRINLLTMPEFDRGIAIWGEGDAVTQLGQVDWLADNRVIYWGDIDVEGFEALSSLRRLFPDAIFESTMMDRETLRRFAAWVVEGHTGSVPPRLTIEEQATFQECAENCRRLEQEKIPQPYVDEQIRRLMRVPIPS